MSVSALCLLVAVTAAAPPDMAAFSKDFAAKRSGIDRLQAQFLEVSLLPDEELSTKGSLLYVRPRRILYHTGEPDRTTLVDGNYGYEYEPELKQLSMYDLEEYPQVDAFFLGFDEDLESLSKTYVVELFTVQGETEGSLGIRLKPKPEDAEDAYFQKVEIFLRDKDYLPFRIEIDNEQDSKTFINFDPTSYVINGPIKEEDTQILVAEGTDIILNNEVIRTTGAGGERLPDAAALNPVNTAPAPPLVESTDLPPPAPPASQP